jgi:pyruvate dehydrogenase complex dehydrogenase (E1) component
VLLIKTVKGFGMGKAGEGKNNVHQTKKLTDDDIKAFRDRFNIPVPDSQIKDIPVLQTRRRHARDALPARAAQGARWLFAAPAYQGR